ncbi:MAG: HAMP domain-containing protein, partial [Christensenellaceae bacterium]|nr:HAMP domain-containing protein [Christensenellaceae bacterium]
MSKISKLTTSIRWRFLFIYLVVLIVAFLLVGVLVSHIIEDNLLSQQLSLRMRQVNDFSVSIAQPLQMQDADALYEQAVEQGRSISGRVIVVDELGIVQTDSFSALNGARLTDREVLEVLSGELDCSHGYHLLANEDGTKSWAAYYTAAIIKDAAPVGAVVFSEDIQSIVDKIDAIKLQYLAIFAAATVVILVLSIFLTNHISRPLWQLRENALQLSRGNFSARVDIRGKDELAQLGRAFNSMAARLENVDQLRSEFVSNASHELKTPLASMKILVESLLYQEGIPEEVYKDFLGDVNQEIDRLNNIIGDLL